MVAVFFLSACASILKYKGDKNISENADFSKQVIIKSDESAEDKKSESIPPNVQSPAQEKPTVVTAPVKEPAKVKPVAQSKVKITNSKKKTAKNKTDLAKEKEPAPQSTVLVRQPDIEDAEGFDPGSRRPKVDPFQVGEVVTHSVRYFAAQAGVVTFKVRPFVEVNNSKSYSFLVDLKSTGIFSKFYSVDDQVETFVDYNTLNPYVFKLHLKESAQLKEAQSFFDQKSLKATYWENKYTEKDGNTEKKLEWEILPFSQNAFSGIFYMRVFKWDIGKEYSFRVSDDQKNIIFKGTALAKEKLDTDAGSFNAIKIKAQIVSRGVLEQAGDILIWVSDDEHKYVLRIEAKIKIGTLVSEVTSIKPGKAE